MREANTKNGQREAGRDGWTMQTIMDKHASMIEEAGLQPVEVLVLRLYTGPMYIWYNNLLRYHGKPFNEKRPGPPFDDYKKDPAAQFPFCTTIHGE